jgi:hypothetical protein
MPRRACAWKACARWPCSSTDWASTSRRAAPSWWAGCSIATGATPRRRCAAWPRCAPTTGRWAARPGDGEAALAACDRMLATFAEDTDAAVQRTVASALLNKGHVLLELLGRAEEALAVYGQLVTALRDASAPEHQVTLGQGFGRARGLLAAPAQGRAGRCRRTAERIARRGARQAEAGPRPGRCGRVAGGHRAVRRGARRARRIAAPGAAPPVRAGAGAQGLLPARAVALRRCGRRRRRDGRQLRRRRLDRHAGAGGAVPAIQEHGARPPRPARRRDARARPDRCTLGQLRAARAACARGRCAVPQGGRAAPGRAARRGRRLLRRGGRAHGGRPRRARCSCGPPGRWSTRPRCSKSSAMLRARPRPTVC